MTRSKKILLTTATILSAAILISVIHHYQLKAAVNRYISELKAKGEPMELAQVLPSPVPPEQNGAEALREADALFNALFGANKSLLATNYVYGMRMVAPGKAMVRWQQPDIRDIDGTNSWENVKAAVVQNAKAFALLQQIIKTPIFSFPVKYARGVADLSFTNLYLAQSKSAALRLEAAELCELNQGDTVSAVKNLRAMLAIVKAIRDERFEISELVRIAIAQIALTANWELLQSPNLSDQQLADLQHDWMNFDFIASNANALAMERVTGRITTAKWRRSGSELEYYLGTWTRLGLSDQEETTLDKLKVKIKVFLWRYWWSYPDEIRQLKSYEMFLETARFAETNYSLQTVIAKQKKGLAAMKLDKAADEFDGFSDPAKIDMHSLLSQDATSLSAIFDKVMKVEAAKQMIITAIALKRYQLKHGNYPPDLNSLVLEFLSVVPLDPVDGQPLRYRSNTDEAFTLYSVGENGVDDGGDPSLENGVTSSGYYWLNNHALDWVWPQPATPAEIEYFREHLPK